MTKVGVGTTILDWVHIKTDIPEGGRTFVRTATLDECASLAAALGILGCSRLDVRYEVKPLSGGRYRCHGKMTAAMTQACVVTIEPVAATLDEALDVSFWPAAEIPDETDGEREILSEPDIEPLVDGRIEIGRIVYELVAASIDPYPRKDGADFVWSDDKPEDKEPSPFAVLSKLKDKL